MPLPTSLIRDYGPAIAWGVVAIGWMINNKQANKRERRKEIREEINQVNAILQGIAKSLSELLNLEDSSMRRDIAYLQITTSLHDLDLMVEHIFGRPYKDSSSVYIDRVSKHQEDFFDHVSGDFVLNPSQDIDERNLYSLKAHSVSAQIIADLKKFFLNEFDQ